MTTDEIYSIIMILLYMPANSTLFFTLCDFTMLLLEEVCRSAPISIAITEEKKQNMTITKNQTSNFFALL